MVENTIKYNLPAGWAISKLVEIADINMGQSPSSDTYNYDRIGLPFFQGKAEFGDMYPTIDKYCSDPIKVAQKNDILISVRAPIGPTNIAPENCCIGRGLAGIRSYGQIPQQYILQYIRYIESDIVDLGTGSTFKAISKKDLEDILIPIAPLQEQYNIVDRIETMFSEIDSAKQSFKKASVLLNALEYSILKDAFEGDLTKTWRNENSGFSAFEFLKEVSEKRKQEFDSSIQNQEKLRKKKANYDFEFRINNKISTWATAKLDKLITIAARVGWKGLKKEEYTSSGPLFISVHSLNHGKIVNFENTNHISIERFEESPEIMLKVNDILLCKDGAGIGKLGIVKQLPGEATINSSLLIVRGEEIFNPDFLYYLFRGPKMQRLVNERVSGSAIPHLFQKDIKEFVLNVPPLLEQEQIVQEIEYRLTILENLKEVINDNLQRTEILRKTILKNAFSGKLTDQNNSDNANELLGKISIERATYIQKLKAEFTLRPKKSKKMEEKKSILQVLESTAEPLSAKEVWLQSKHKDDIESFYSELREIQNKIVEIKKDTESLLSLRHEN